MKLNDADYFLTVDEHPREKGKLVAIITQGHFAIDSDKVHVLTLEVFNVGDEIDNGPIDQWFAKEMKEKKWETRQ